MHFSTDKYLAWEFDQRTSNCWDLARAAWQELTGVDLGHQTPEDVSPASLQNSASKKACQLKEISEPVSPCLVLMIRQRLAPHIGVYWNRRVLHVTKHGASYESLDHVTVGYPTVRYYVNQDQP